MRRPGRGVRRHRQPDRHVLVVRLIRGRASRRELRRGRSPLRRQSRVVVRHFVVVPDHGEWELRVRGLQIGIELVERVAQPVGAQIDGLALETFGRRDAAAGRPVDRVLVGVVAEVQDEIEIVPQHIAVGGVVAARPVLACGEREADLARHLVLRRRRPEVPDRALLATGVELVEVVASREQAVDLDVYRMRERRRARPPRRARRRSACRCRARRASRPEPPTRPGAAGFAGSGASRVHSTMPSAVGSPEATPSENGLSPNLREANRSPPGRSASDRLAATPYHA